MNATESELELAWRNAKTQTKADAAESAWIEAENTDWREIAAQAAIDGSTAASIAFRQARGIPDWTPIPLAGRSD